MAKQEQEFVQCSLGEEPGGQAKLHLSQRGAPACERGRGTAGDRAWGPETFWYASSFKLSPGV